MNKEQFLVEIKKISTERKEIKQQEKELLEELKESRKICEIKTKRKLETEIRELIEIRNNIRKFVKKSPADSMLEPNEKMVFNANGKSYTLTDKGLVQTGAYGCFDTDTSSDIKEYKKCIEFLKAEITVLIEAAKNENEEREKSIHEIRKLKEMIPEIETALNNRANKNRHNDHFAFEEKNGNMILVCKTGNTSVTIDEAGIVPEIKPYGEILPVLDEKTVERLKEFINKTPIEQMLDELYQVSEKFINIFSNERLKNKAYCITESDKKTIDYSVKLNTTRTEHGTKACVETDIFIPGENGMEKFNVRASKDFVTVIDFKDELRHPVFQFSRMNVFKKGEPPAFNKTDKPERVLTALKLALQKEKEAIKYAEKGAI